MSYMKSFHVPCLVCGWFRWQDRHCPVCGAAHLCNGLDYNLADATRGKLTYMSMLKSDTMYHDIRRVARQLGVEVR